MINPLAGWRQRTYLRKVVANSSWLIAYQVIRLGLSMLVGVWLARYLGPESLGTLQYAITFVLLFSPFIIFGLRPILMRSYVLHEDKANIFIGSAFFITSNAFLLVFLVLILPLNFWLHYGDIKFELILIISILLFFDFAKVLECWFDSQVASKFIVIARFCSLLISSVARISLIISEASLFTFAWVVTLESVLFSVILLIIYTRKVTSPIHWRVKLDTVNEFLKTGWPLLLSSFSATIYLKIDKVMLSQLASDTATGLYSAATMLSESYYFIGNALINSVSAGLISLYQDSQKKYHTRFSQILTVYVIIVLCTAVPVTFFSYEIIRLIFGEQFIEAAPVLAIHIWAGLFVFFALIEKNWLVNAGLIKMIMYRTMLGAVLNIILNFILIPSYGATGAAIATLVSYSFICFFGNLLTPRTFFMFRLELEALYLKPVLAKLSRSSN